MPKREPVMTMDLNHAGWRFRRWDDGTEQWMRLSVRVGSWPVRMTVERVCRTNTRRKLWYVVSRWQRGKRYTGLYPPAVSGPFDTADAAKAALVVLEQTKLAN